MLFLLIFHYLLCFPFIFVECNDNKTKFGSDKYLNDFEALENGTRFDAIFYDDYDVTLKALSEENLKHKDVEVKDDKKLFIYPDPDLTTKHLSNKSNYDENVIKIYTSRVRSKAKLNENQSQQLGTYDPNYDLKGHDFIDSIMYIYYGKNSTRDLTVGANIIVIGSVLGLAGQILTIIVVFLKNRRTRKTNAFFPITFNLLLCFCAANLLFIVGVQAIKNPIKCEIISLCLHYLHLTTSVWCFIYIYVIYDLLINDSHSAFSSRKCTFLGAYCVPALFVTFSYACTGANLKKFCFMSIHKMIISYLVPNFILIVASTILGTICLKHISKKNREMLCESIDSSISEANFEKFVTNKEILASLYFLKQHHEASLAHIRCCEDQGNYDDQIYAKKMGGDCYDSKFDLGQLSLADLSIESSSSNSHDFTNFKKATQFAMFFQTFFAICWFASVLALENIHSYAFAVVFSICFNILNWTTLMKSHTILPFMKHFDNFYNYEDQCDNCPNGINDEEFEDEEFSKKDTKNNKNLLNQLFQSSNSLNTLLGGSLGSNVVQKPDTIPLLYTTPPPQSHFNHHKSIGNLPSMKDQEANVFKAHHRSEHDLIQHQQQMSNLLFSTGIIKGNQIVRNSWDTNLNLDCISTISN